MKSKPSFLRGTKKSLTDQPFINNEDEQQREHDFLCIKAFYCLSFTFSSPPYLRFPQGIQQHYRITIYLHTPSIP